MKVVTIREPGGPDSLVLSDVPAPRPGVDEVLIDVAATAVNRADLMQRQGHYPPPEGAPAWPGLECSGVISAIGDAAIGRGIGQGADGEGVHGWSVGDRVCALLSGGGYAEQVVVPAGQLLPVPEGLDLIEAAALPEVVCTVWSNVFMLAALQPGELLLVHGGGSGIGTIAIQLARELGARIAVTAGSAEKLERCAELGAGVLVNYRHQDFVEVVRDATGGRGADVVLDNMGGAYLGRNVDVLATSGRLVVIGMQGGRKGELDLGTLLTKRAAVLATSLRARPPAEKAAIVASVREHVWPLVADGRIRPVVHARMPLARAADAHRMVEESSHIGKVVLTVG